MRAFFAAGQLSASLPSNEGELEDDSDERCTLTLTLSQRDAWLFEWTRRFVEHTGGKLGTDGTVSALLAETFSSLCCELPANDLERCVAESNPDATRTPRQAVRGVGTGLECLDLRLVDGSH